MSQVSSWLLCSCIEHPLMSQNDAVDGRWCVTSVYYSSTADNSKSIPPGGSKQLIDLCSLVTVVNDAILYVYHHTS